MNAKEIGQTILQQLGGNHFVAMTGAKDLCFLPATLDHLGGLRLTVGKGGGFNDTGINRVEITLDGSDTYKMNFLKVRKGFVRKGKFYDGSIAIISEVKDVYCDQLQDIFEQKTNLLCTMFPRR